jgi:predicted phage tail protein
VTVAQYNIYEGTSAGGESSATILAQGTSCTVTGLSDGTTYYFTVAAVNDAGRQVSGGAVS